MPQTADRSQIDALSTQLVDTASELNIDIVGGHTEVTTAVRRIVISLTMIGKSAVPGRFIATSGMRSGDVIIMSKYAGIEGTLILAADRARELERVLDASDYDQINYLKSCLSVLPEGLAGAMDSKVSAMHDITEGGLIGAASEMCVASGLGISLDLSKVPVMPVTKKICDFFSINPLRLISSGSMLIAASEQTNILSELADRGIPATVVGHVHETPGLTDAETGQELQAFPQDDLYRAISSEQVRS